MGRVGDSSPRVVEKTPSPPECPSRGSIHPHLSGENAYEAANWFENGDSSPRVWRKLIALLQFGACLRLIPTYVEKTSRSSMLRVWEDDSSPRAWRKRKNRVEWLRLNRLIPAQVGKTGFVSGSNVRISTHPRARGKNGQYNNQWLMETDSSPPVWRKRRAGLPTVRLFDSSPCVWRKLSGVSVYFLSV
jgi:hypothetical protein